MYHKIYVGNLRELEEEIFGDEVQRSVLGRPDLVVREGFVGDVQIYLLFGERFQWGIDFADASQS